MSINSEKLGNKLEVLEAKMLESFDKIVADDRNLVQDLKINKDNLEGEFLQQPTANTYWVVAASILRGACLKAKQKLKEVEGLLDQQFRMEAESTGQKITETGVKNKIQTSDIYKEALNRFNELKVLGGEDGNEGAAWGVVKNMNQKGELLKTIAIFYTRDEILRASKN